MTDITDAELQSLPDDILRAALIALCNYDADLRARMALVLRVAAASVGYKRTTDDAADDQELPEARRQKRKADDTTDDQELPEARRQKLEGLRVCVKCDMPYLQSENGGHDCWHHPEEAELDEDSYVWNDHKHGYLGRAARDDDDWDTPDNRRDRPRGFKHWCCGEELSETDGCSWGKHYASMEEWKNDPLRGVYQPPREDKEE